MTQDEKLSISRRQVLAGIAGLAGTAGAAAWVGGVFDRPSAPRSWLNGMDYIVPIKSTIPANFGQDAFIFIRRIWLGSWNDSVTHPQVVMVAGRTTPALVSFDLLSDAAGGRYSWAKAIAEAGLVVWIMEVQGMGRSSRPDKMNNKCNILKSDQQRAFGQELCAPAYAMHLGHSKSEWDELDAVVEYVKRVTKQSKVVLIGYSAGAYVVGPYAMQNPSKVRGLVLLAPIFPPNGPSGWKSIAYHPRPGDPLLIPPISTPEAFYGAPMGVVTKESIWPRPETTTPDPTCPDPPRNEAVIDDLWKAMMESETHEGDGYKPRPVFETGTSTEVSRYPTRYWWGWNDPLVKDNPNLGKDIPVLIIYGLKDGLANRPAYLTDGRGEFSVPRLYDAILGPRKLMYEIECAEHLIVWQEPYRRRLHELSIPWLQAVEGPAPFPNGGTGRFFVPRYGAPRPWNGNVVPPGTTPRVPRRLPGR